MSEKPILFSGPMVRGLLDGRKTQTRRILKDQPGELDKPLMMDDGSWHVTDSQGGHMTSLAVPFRKGDRLWVRETISFGHKWTGTKPRDVPPGSPVWYWADGNPQDGDWTKPIVSIHMPRWCSRLTDIVTDVRVQSLLDISEMDAEAEGFKAGQLDDGFGPRDFGGGFTVESPGTYASAAGMFQLTWQNLHPEWDGYSSPWVVALTFTVEPSPNSGKEGR